MNLIATGDIAAIITKKHRLNKGGSNFFNSIASPLTCNPAMISLKSLKT